MATIRQEKIARLLQKELGAYFQKNAVSFRNVLISVTIVRVTPDMSIARSYLSIFPSDKTEEVMNAIEDKKSLIRKAIGIKVGKQLRIVPELEFFVDDSLDYIQNIENLLK